MRGPAVLVGLAVLLAAPAAVARPRARPPQSQPARVAKETVYRPPRIVVKGEKPAPVKLVLGRQAPKLELRVLERDARVQLVETVRRAPF
jgi:hypothetical protein